MEKMEMETLSSLIIEWAKEKGITNKERQYLKIVEEVGETCGAILKNNREEIIDGIGDMGVTIIIYAWQNHSNLNFDECRKQQEKEISSREDIIIEDLFQSLYEFDSFRALLGTINLATRQGLVFEDCLNSAWQVIKNRKGKTVNGTFIKNEDDN